MDTTVARKCVWVDVVATVVSEVAQRHLDRVQADCTRACKSGKETASGGWVCCVECTKNGHFDDLKSVADSQKK